MHDPRSDVEDTYRSLVAALQAESGVREASARLVLAISKNVDCVGCSDEYPATFPELFECEIRNRTLLAAWLVRLLPKLHQLRDVRTQVVACVKEVFAPKFPKNYFDRQGHEVFESLTHEYSAAVGSLNSAVAKLTSFSQTSSTKHAVMQALKKSPAKHLLSTWIPEGFEGVLNEFFVRVEEYANAEDNILGAYEAFLDVARQLHDLFPSQTEIDGAFLQLIDSASRLVEQKHSTSPAKKPGWLSVAVNPKTYPLHVVHQKFVLPVTIKNEGAGFALDGILTVVSDAELDVDEFRLPRLSPSESQRVEIAFSVSEPAKDLGFILQVEWHSYDGKKSKSDVEIRVRAQRSDVDWFSIDRSMAYSLEPVEAVENLVGRSEVLSELIATLHGAVAGSAIVRGQKRVGKTSLAKVVRKQLEDVGTHVVYLEAGDYMDPSAEGTVRNLGSRICRALKKIPAFAGEVSPVFSSSLAPLTEFVEELSERVSVSRFLIVLDEFDELPPALFERDAVGNAFFMGIRSLSSRANVSLLIVGGEKLSLVLEKQADKLNKFAVRALDYFRKESDWDEYVSLVTKPTSGIIGFDSDAVERIFQLTNGNPYFTNLLCKRLLDSAFSRRDSVVALDDVERESRLLARMAERNSFQHFWEDGIISSSSDASEVSIRRRKTLIAVSDSLVKEGAASLELLSKHPLVYGADWLSLTLKEFVQRKILLERGGEYNFVVPIFRSWLNVVGVGSLLGTLADTDEGVLKRRQDEELKVKEEELEELAIKWRYHGFNSTTESIRAWLDQFEDLREKRYMFRLAQGLHVFGQKKVKALLEASADAIQKVSHDRVGQRRLTYEELFVSHLGSPAKSGALMTRLYCQVHSLPGEVVIEESALRARIEDSTKVRVVLFLDDFIGTGDSASDLLRKARDLMADLVMARDLRIVYFAAVATADGLERVRAVAAELRFSVTVEAGEILDPSSVPFSQYSRLFDSVERKQVEDIARKYGERLSKAAPLGYAGQGLLVAFPHAIPNNTLPIIRYSSAKKPTWRPLVSS